MFDRTLWSCLTEHFDRSDRSGICPQDLRDCPRSNCSPSLKPSDVAPPSSWGSSPLRRRDGVALSELRLNPTPGPVTPWLSWKWSTGRPQTAQLLRGKQTAPTPKKQIYIYIYTLYLINQSVYNMHHSDNKYLCLYQTFDIIWWLNPVTAHCHESQDSNLHYVV